MDKDSDNGGSITDEVKLFNNRFSLNKIDYDLYNDEKNTVEQIIRVKRFTNPNERWKIFADQKLLFIIDCNKINKKESSFLRTIDGCSFMISEVKSGVSSFSAFKAQLKKKMIELKGLTAEKS